MVYFVFDIKTMVSFTAWKWRSFWTGQAQQNRAFILKTLNTCSYPIVWGFELKKVGSQAV
jgi:hypothetical protein